MTRFPAAILYIRDTRSDEKLYSETADGKQDDTAKDEEDQDEEMERPSREGRHFSASFLSISGGGNIY